MVRNTFLLLLFIFGISTAYAQTLVSGGIYNNVTWTLASSPYIVTGDIVVFPGKTLTIEPGVEVRVQGNGYPFGIGTYIEIRGSIVAVGTPTAPITFKADGVVTDPWTWRGIQIQTQQGADGNFNYINMSNAYNGFASDGYVIRPGVTEFNNCNFSDNYISVNPWYSSKFVDCNFVGNGIGVQPASSYDVEVELLRCNFEDNEIALTYCWDTATIDSCVFLSNDNPLISFGNGTVRNCLFDGNDIAFNGYSGLVSDCEFINNNTAVTNFAGGSITNCVIRNNQLGVELSPGGTLQNNEISNNVIGVKIFDFVANFTDNKICSNTLYNVENGADKNISLVGNCFCESDSTVAEALLYDGYDDITRGLFNFALYDSSCTNVVQLVSKVTIPTGITAPLGDMMVAYPNPGTEFLEVRLPEGASGSLSLSNLQGQVLLRQDAAVQTRLDVAGLPAGIYLLAYQGVDRQVIKWIKK
jgi:Secretion system C-terminal sorting domain